MNTAMDLSMEVDEPFYDCSSNDSPMDYDLIDEPNSDSANDKLTYYSALSDFNHLNQSFKENGYTLNIDPINGEYFFFDTNQIYTDDEETDQLNELEPRLPTKIDIANIGSNVAIIRSTYQRVKSKVEEYTNENKQILQRIRELSRSVLLLDHHRNRLAKFPNLENLPSKVKAYKLMLGNIQYSKSKDHLKLISNLFYKPYHEFKKIYESCSYDSDLIPYASELQNNLDILTDIHKTYQQLKKQIVSEFFRQELIVYNLRSSVARNLHRSVNALMVEDYDHSSAFRRTSQYSNLHAFKRQLDICS